MDVDTRCVEDLLSDTHLVEAAVFYASRISQKKAIENLYVHMPWQMSAVPSFSTRK